MWVCVRVGVCACACASLVVVLEVKHRLVQKLERVPHVLRLDLWVYMCVNVCVCGLVGVRVCV